MFEDEEILAIFTAEVEELLEALATAIEEDAASWSLSTLLHITHTFKGSSRMVGARSMESLAHLLEERLLEIKDPAELDTDAVAQIREGFALLESLAENLREDRSEEIEAYRQRLSAGQTASPTLDHASDDAPRAERPEPSASLGRAGSELTIRVGTEKVDQLMGLASDFLAVGYGLRAQQRTSTELALACAQLLRRPGLSQSQELRALTEQLAQLERSLAKTTRDHERMTRELYDGTRSLRMIRTRALTGIFARTVRSVARAVGKRARFVIEGGSTEIDRVTLDALRDPLLHMVRNAVAHGIEIPVQRRRAGKPEVGVVTLAARSAGSSVVLELRDDGAGLDLEALRREALARGTMSTRELEQASEQRLHELIFDAGLSTQTAGEISGRGLGMSVVREHVERLGGNVVVSSVTGQGCAIKLEVPLTRLTTMCAQVRVGGHDFLIPFTNLRSTALFPCSAIEQVDGREVIIYQQRSLPLLRLERVFGYGVEARDQRPVVVVQARRESWALMCDEVVGQTAVVIQPLAAPLAQLRGICGAAVIEGERVVPVLDVGELLRVSPESLAPLASLGELEPVRMRQLLVVDDSITSRTLLKNILSAAGYGVELAVDGDAALERLRAQTFDLVVTDVEMPGLDGFELTRRIRASTATRDVPVIICTSLANGAEKARGATAGADAYVVKGHFDQDELLAAVARLC